MRKRDVRLTDEMQGVDSKGVYVGVEDDEEDIEDSDVNDDGLQDIWREMTVVMECSKVLSFYQLTYYSY